MGKTLGSIITLGVAVAVNVVPGIGQAISGAIVGLGGGTFAAYGVAQAIVGALTLGATVAGLSAGLSLLGVGPSQPKPETTETAIKVSRPPRVSAYGQSRLYFAYILYETSSGGVAVDVGAVHDGLMDGVVQFYLNDDAVTLSGNTVQPGTDGRYADGKVKLYWSTGAATGSGFPALTSLLPGIWTSTHRGDGCVILAMTAEPVKSKKFLSVYPNNVPTASIAARWQRCPDPAAADPTNESGWTWTENPIRQLLHYKLVREGVDYATKIRPTIAHWIEAAARCDEQRPLKGGGSEAMYRSCVAHKHTDTHAGTTGALLATCDGWIAPRADGALVVFAGQYIEPTVEIGPEHIVAYDWSGVGVDDDSAVNELVCSYISAVHDYTSVETDAWRDEDDIAARGQVLSENFALQVPSHAQIRYLAKRKMARVNAVHRGTCTTNVAGRVVRGHRYIRLRIEEAGTVFFNGVAEITGLTRNLQTGGVTFSWVAASAGMDTWNPATEEGEPAANGSRVAPVPLDPPAITTAIANFDAGYCRIAISGGGPDRDDLTWFARTRVLGESAWTEAEYTDTAPGSAVTIIAGPVASNADIEVEIAYAVGDGRVSPWSATETVDTTAP